MVALHAQVHFRAETARSQVIEKEIFQVNYILDKSDASNFRGPEFHDFIVISRPSRHIDSTKLIYNYKGEIQFSYYLMPRNTGKFELSPASILVDGKRIYSNSLQIEVLIERQVDSSNEQSFVRMELDAPQVYLGQQLVLSYKLYTTQAVETFYFTAEPLYTGFYHEDAHEYSPDLRKEVIDGVEYSTRILKKVVLFPQRTGLRTISPAEVRLGVRGNSLFKIDRFTVRTDSAIVEVLPLNQPPSTFSGAVGNYHVKAQLPADQVLTDEYLTLILSIEGNGDLMRIQPPDIHFPASFELLEPEVVEEISEERGGVFWNKKTINYKAIPQSIGKYQIIPSFTFFDTEKKEFRTLTPDTFDLAVLKNTKKEPLQSVQMDSNDRSQESLSGNRSPLFILLMIVSSVLLLTFAYWTANYLRQKWAMRNAEKYRAKKRALVHLNAAQTMLQTNKSRAFYDEIYKALLSYARLKFDISLSEFSDEHLSRQLKSFNVSDENLRAFKSILRQSEMALFSGHAAPATMNDMFQKSVKIISDLELELVKSYSGLSHNPNRK